MTPTNDTIIRISDLSKSFGQKHVLRHVSISLNKGENLAVLGRSGTGKTVLIKCIIRLIEPDAGEIVAFGKNITSAGKKELNKMRQRMGFVFQSGALYDSMNVRGNLAFHLSRSHEKTGHTQMELRIREALSNVGLEHTIDLMPSELSGGMKKRVSLARALIMRPEIMLYDEPSTGLDPVTSHEISHLILDMQKKYSTSSIIITHDMECVRITSNRIVMISDGSIIANGTYAELSASNEPLVRSFFHTSEI
jgi:phospholipid/cholesterol/gamma-HCH transport system ATP-binding protein